MADDITVPGLGAVLATDQIGSKHYPIGKTAFGSLDTVILVSEEDPFPVSATLSADQDPIFDHANGTKQNIVSSDEIITPPTGCKYVNIISSEDIVINTAGENAVDDGTGYFIPANQALDVPVTEDIVVNALSLSGTAIVRVMPWKAR